MKIGFIGLGIMGSRMAANLLKSGYSLILNNRSKEKAIGLMANGAEWADSPKELAEKADLVITMLSTPEVVREIALGGDGFIDYLEKSKIWIDCTTVSPSDSRFFSEEAGKRGIRFIDAPVSGTKAPAENAQLIFLTGGNKNDVEEVRPILDAMGKAVVYGGTAGSGSSLKMVVNLLLGQSMIAFCEAIALGMSYGIEQDILFTTLRNVPVSSPFLNLKSSKIENADYEPEFPLQWMHKDLHLAAVSAYENNIPLPSLNIAKEIFGIARTEGYGQLDLTAVFEAFYKHHKKE